MCLALSGAHSSIKGWLRILGLELLSDDPAHSTRSLRLDDPNTSKLYRIVADSCPHAVAIDQVTLRADREPKRTMRLSLVVPCFNERTFLGGSTKP